MTEQIQSILTEWTYRLPKGYPTEIKDYDALRDILREMSDLPEAEQERVVQRAMGLEEDDDEQKPASDDFMTSVDSFIKYIQQYYTVSGQMIENLDALYNKLKSIPQPAYDDVINILKDTNPYYPLTRSDIRILGTALILYNACKVIKIPNGHWSELFFAFVFKGRVKAGVAAHDIIQSHNLLFHSIIIQRTLEWFSIQKLFATCKWNHKQRHQCKPNDVFTYFFHIIKINQIYEFIEID